MERVLMLKSKKIILLSIFFTAFSVYANASVAHQKEQNILLLVLSLIIGGAALSWVVRKAGLPAVTGELGLGMLFAVLAHYNISFWPSVTHSSIIAFFAEIGSILLLFEIGLESSVDGLFKVGKYGLITAIIGVIVPFCLGYWLLGDIILSSHDVKLNLFLAATLAATSTGISVRVFKDLGIINNSACQIVLAASIIDDILGLIILAFVSGLVIAGSTSYSAMGLILLNVGVFFFMTLVLARKITPNIINQVLRISNDEPMVLAILLSFCLFWSWTASLVGLAPIIGAFVAGLIIDEIAFRRSLHPYWYNRILEMDDREGVYQEFKTDIIGHYYKERLSNLVKPLNHAFVPIFFVYAGMQVDIIAVANFKIILYGVAISLIAIAGKLVSGIFLPKSVNKLVVGFGMVPRGEIGLIFALTGKELGVFSQEIFAAILIMVIITSLVTPIALQKIVGGGKV
ncbi:MAG: cation:proton antiporter [Neisseriales bacterium]|nr:MAG: cation:proton antiporter [Neisseriales bacterium]